MGTIDDHIRESIAAKERLRADAAAIRAIDVIAHRCAAAVEAGGKVLTAGNGGSAADAQHMAGELVSRFRFNRPAAPGLALTTDTSVLTAIGNDYGFEQVFARQIAALGRAGDAFVAISTSGKSPNILSALREAKTRGLYCVGLTGADGGLMRPLCDAIVCVPSDQTPRIQEVHGMIIHILCAQIEMLLFSKPEPARPC